MGSKLTETGVTFGNFTTEQTKPVVSVNSIEPDNTGKITVPTPQSFIDRVEALEDVLGSSSVYAMCSSLGSEIIQISNGSQFAGIAGSSDGYHVGTNYAIFYYAGAYSIKFHSDSCSTSQIPIKITILSGAGGGAGGYQAQHNFNVGMHQATGNGEDGHNAIDNYTQVRSAAASTGGSMSEYHGGSGNRPNRTVYKASGSAEVIDTWHGWSASVRQGTIPQSGEWLATPPYNQYYNVYRPKQEPTILTGRIMNKGVEYLVYVGSGGDGGHGAGGNADWYGVGAQGGDGGPGGTRGQGTNGENGAKDGAMAAYGGTGGIAGGKSGATYVNDNSSSVDINIGNTKINKSLDGFGQVGATGATGISDHHHDDGAKDTGGGGGGGGGSNGIVLIEWGDI